MQRAHRACDVDRRGVEVSPVEDAAELLDAGLRREIAQRRTKNLAIDARHEKPGEGGLAGSLEQELLRPGDRMVAPVAEGGIEGRTSDHHRKLAQRGLGGLAAVELDATGGVSPHLQNGTFAAAAELGTRNDRL